MSAWAPRQFFIVVPIAATLVLMCAGGTQRGGRHDPYSRDLTSVVRLFGIRVNQMFHYVYFLAIPGPYMECRVMGQ